MSFRTSEMELLSGKEPDHQGRGEKLRLGDLQELDQGVPIGEANSLKPYGKLKYKIPLRESSAVLSSGNIL